MRAMLPHKFAAERLSHTKVAVQIMMQSGLLSTFDVSEGCCALVSSHEWLVRGVKLGKQTADFMLEGLCRTMPFFLEYPEQAIKFCGIGSLIVGAFSCDRASANFRACAWLWKQLETPKLSRVLPHIEPCALHAIRLVKCRAQGARHC